MMTKIIDPWRLVNGYGTMLSQLVFCSNFLLVTAPISAEAKFAHISHCLVLQRNIITLHFNTMAVYTAHSTLHCTPGLNCRPHMNDYLVQCYTMHMVLHYTMHAANQAAVHTVSVEK